MQTSEQYVQNLDQHEESLIEQFRKHPVLSTLKQITQDEFENLLLERRLLALDVFEPMYNRGLCGLEDETAKEIVREIIREEYPIAHPNHREDALSDLMLIGIPKERILAIKPSVQTRAARDVLINLVEYLPYGMVNHTEDNYELRILTTLRVAGEVLPGIEHQLLWSEIERRYQKTSDQSRYYVPHGSHDSKRCSLGALGKSHADRLGVVLATKITDQAAYEKAQQYMHACYTTRTSFYDQFMREK